MAVVCGTAVNVEMSRVQFLLGSLEFFVNLNLPPHSGPRFFSASGRNEYQECLLGVKAAGA